jgi:hypothetical protein
MPLVNWIRRQRSTSIQLQKYSVDLDRSSVELFQFTGSQVRRSFEIDDLLSDQIIDLTLGRGWVCHESPSSNKSRPSLAGRRASGQGGLCKTTYCLRSYARHSTSIRIRFLTPASRRSGKHFFKQSPLKERFQELIPPIQTIHRWKEVSAR